MGFIKRHYEKILLSLVLLGLAAAAAWLTVKVGAVKKELGEEKQKLNLPGGAPENFTSAQELVQTLTLVSNPPPVELDGPHLLFNPVLWKQRPDGTIFPIRTGSEAGVGALKVTAVKPLSFTIKFDKASGSSPDRMRYAFDFHEQDAVDNRGRPAKPKKKYASVGGKLGDWPFGEATVAMELKEAQGDPLAPTGFVFGLKDADGQDMTETISFTVDAPYEEVRQHLIDLQYEPTNTDFKDQREGDKITLDGESYNIVAISEVQIVLSAERNRKRYVIPIESASGTVP